MDTSGTLAPAKGNTLILERTFIEAIFTNILIKKYIDNAIHNFISFIFFNIM